MQTESGFSLNQVLRWPTLRSKQWTENFVLSANQDSNIIAIVAIGSAVRPNVSSSDFDLLTLYADSKSLKESPPIEVDLRVYFMAGIEDRIGRGHDLLTWSIMFGRVLYQRKKFWDNLVSAWSYRLPLPSAKLARERAETVFRHLSEILKLRDENAAREQAISYLTHLVRAELLERGIFPASRPELPGQLKRVSNSELADNLEYLLSNESIELADIDALVRLAS